MTEVLSTSSCYFGCLTILENVGSLGVSRRTATDNSGQFAAVTGPLATHNFAVVTKEPATHTFVVITKEPATHNFVVITKEKQIAKRSTRHSSVVISKEPTTHYIVVFLTILESYGKRSDVFK